MWETIKTPAYVVDEKKLRENLECLHRVEEETGCHILLAQKAFSMFRVYPLIGSYLSGTTASGLYEARLGYEEMKKENHVFAPAYKTEDMKELVTICDHIIFNSFAQFEKHKEIISEYNNSQSQKMADIRSAVMSAGRTLTTFLDRFIIQFIFCIEKI